MLVTSPERVRAERDLAGEELRIIEGQIGIRDREQAKVEAAAREKEQELNMVQ